MRRFITGIAIASMFLMSLLAIGSSGALADTGNGAVQDPMNGVININSCEDSGTTTVCTVVKGEYHGVQAASGGVNVQVNVQSECYTVTDDVTGSWHTNCDSGHAQLHLDQAGDERGNSQNVTYSYTDSDGNTECSTIVFHYANGQIQYDHSSDTC